ncbi:MAG: DUF177 domain-containing protein [Calditrichia bacterium]
MFDMKIPILHLEDDVHHFQQVVESNHLSFKEREVYRNGVNVSVELNKFGRNITCSVHLSSTAHHVCDRCLGEYDRQMEEDFEVLFHLGADDLKTDEDEVIIISPEEVEIDLLPYIEENLILSIPMKSLCKEECLGLCPNCGADLNFEKCTCNTEKIDPRWEKLKDLLQ